MLKRNETGWEDQIDFRFKMSAIPGLNNSVRTPILIYNAVPKCGSSTTMFHIRTLSQKNGFIFTYDVVRFVEELKRKQGFVPDREGYNRRQELEYLQFIYSRVNRKKVFGHHGVFVDAEDHGIPDDMRPNWINVIRDPIDQQVSLYYHASGNKETDEAVFALDHLPYSVSYPSV